MNKIEPLHPEVTDNLRKKIKVFWEKNVNAETLLGKKVSAYERGDEKYFHDLEQQRYRSHGHLLPWIEEMESGKSVLDIGCGIGMDTFRMAKRGMQVTGIDLTEVAIKTAKRRFEKQGIEANFEVGDATDLRFSDESFDYVYSFGVLHHTQDTEKSIQEVYRVLKKGGMAKIMLYNRNSINEIIHRVTGIPFEDKTELCPVVRRFSVREVKEMFRRFSDIAIRKEYVFGEGYGILFKLMPKQVYSWLSRYFGWHIMITAKKNAGVEQVLYK